MRSAYECKHTPDLESRFWGYVAKGDNSECWLWRLAVHPDRGGQFCAGGWTVSAHRYAWESANKRPIPPGKIVAQVCGDWACCNPAHLRVVEPGGGKLVRGTVARGVQNGRTKFTEDDIHVIREQFDRGVAVGVLAKRYGVDPAAIRRIGQRKSWRWLAEKPKPKPLTPEERKAARLRYLIETYGGG